MRQSGASRAFHSVWLREYFSYVYCYNLLFVIVLKKCFIKDARLSVKSHQILGVPVLGDAVPLAETQRPFAAAEQHLSSASKSILF